MLTLLHPAALWTLAALALPLAIHLRRPPPRTVRLGSLHFLENIPRRPLRHLRWRELLLLCARLGLLAALSLLLATPRWVTKPPTGARRWALLDPTARPAGPSLSRWQEARRAGDELRLLAPGFPFASDPPPLPADDAAAPDLWSLLREADAELLTGSTITVFSPARLAALRGPCPELGHCKLEWVQTPDATGDAPHVWFATAPAHSDTWHPTAIVGRSDARSTIYASVEIRDPLRFPGHDGERWKIELSHGWNLNAFSVRVSGRENDPNDLPGPWIASGPLSRAQSVLILRDAEHAADARYVEAAVRAASDAAGQPVNIQNRAVTPDVENAATTDWVFWLSTGPPPENLAARAPRIVRYAGGDATTTAAASRIVSLPGDAVDGTPLWKRAAPTTNNPVGTILWSDGQGNPILSYSHPDAGQRWEFYSRFDPAWTDLPRTSALPAWMRSLLFPETASGEESIHDRRLADPSQGFPSDAPSTTATPTLAPADLPSRDLHWPLWTLAAALFVVERTLSLRRRLTLPTTIQTPRPEPVAAAR